MNKCAPILFLIFNRPEKTEAVFASIREAQPRRLYVAADGPRAQSLTDVSKVKETRAILSQVDWDCEVYTLFRDSNLGCKQAVSGAIDWFFEKESEGIILEDDCLPDASFFIFCTTLLERYRNHAQIGMISGSNCASEQKLTGDYGFSRLSNIWGWATWRRAWKDYDVEMNSWPEICRTHPIFPFLSKPLSNFYKNLFEMIVSGKIDTWDYQWIYTNWKHNRISAYPKVNLVKNIGFDEEAHHSRKGGYLERSSSRSGSLPSCSDVEEIIVNTGYDDFFLRKVIVPCKRFWLAQVLSVMSKITGSNKPFLWI